MSAARRGRFIFSFLIWMPFISLLIALARTSSTTLNRNGENRHSYLCHDLMGKGIQDFISKYNVSCRDFTNTLCHFEEAPTYS